MANNSLEPDPTGIRFIETPIQKYYGIPDKVVYPHILFFVAILIIIGLVILI